MLQRQSTIDSFFVKASPRRTQEDQVNMNADKTSHSSCKEGVGEPGQKRKKLEMSSSECLRRSSTAEGTAPLTSPLSVQKTSRDVNRGLYPRNSRKNHSSNPTLTKLKPRNRQSKLTAVTSSQFKHSGSTFATRSSQNGSETALSKTLPGQRTPTKEMVTSNATIQCKKSWSRSQPRPSSSPSSSSFQFQRSVSMPSMHCQASSDCGRVVSPNTLPNQSTPTKLQASPKATLLSPKSWSKSRPTASVTDQSPGSSHKGPVRSIQAEFDRVASSSPSLEKQTNQMSKAANSSTCDNDIANAERTTNQATNSQLGQTSGKDGSDPNLLAFENDAEMEELMATQIMMENEFDDESEQDAMPNTFGLLGEEMQIEEEEEKNYFEDLPPEVIENIFSQLPMIDLCLNVNRVCRQWNDIISDCKFMPWKKTYHKLKAKDSTTRHEIRQIMRTNNMDSENDSLLQIVRYMKNFTRRSNSFMVDHLKKHPKCDFATEVIKEKVSDTLVEGDPNPWCLITMLVVLSETVKDVQQIIQCILNSSSTTLASNVIECLYCIATFLFALHGMHNLNRGIHYRVFYALYLYENVIVSTPDDWDQSVPSGSGQQSLRRYGTGVCGGIRLTHEQLRIVKYEFEKNDIMKIMAFAGTGKTSTLIDYTKRRPNKQFLYVCYNKSVQEQAEQAFPWNVTCKTIHALAFNTTGRRFVKQLVPEIKSYYVTRELPEKRSYFVRGKQVKETIDSYLASADQVITTRHTPDVYQNKNGERTFITHEQKMAIVQDSELIWEKMQDPDDWKIRMTHDGYLKMFQLMKPTLDQYHCILIDEGQDCTPAAQDILLSQDCPKILVGDPHQQIYSFKGARNAMREAPSSQVFYLTQSFRFGPQIGYIASCVLENFKRITEKTIVGNDKQDSVYGDVEGQVAVITRYNYTLFNEAVILANQETPCRIAFVGGNKYLGDLLGSILDIFTLFCKEGNGNMPRATRHKYLERQIKHKFIQKFKSFRSLKDYADNTQDFELLYKIRIVETHHVNIPSHCEKIKNRCAKNMKFADIVLTTAHKAKGLEFDTVKLTDDFVNMRELPNMGSFRDLPEDELNLLYVAVTRAKKRLQMNRAVQQVLAELDEYFMYPVQSSSLQSEGESLKCCQSQCSSDADMRSLVVFQRKEIKLSTANGKMAGGVKCEAHTLSPAGFTELLRPKGMAPVEESEEEDNFYKKAILRDLGVALD